MHSISLEEVEKRLRVLIKAAQGGQRYSITEDFIPQARIEPPARRDDARDLDFLALKRHLAGCEGLVGPRKWSRAGLYGKKPP